ncbi:hypothetical protein G3U99_10885 [Vibrio coralliilyticus OCN008]|uniref:hypothetical protein n=1 Tax=Vibrio coralliilyticus TaxID=190893 RepID=UPI0003915B2C|nr:hypothetical protein [Vibrio coralliilyticus]ERB62403.1 hypothetical protein N779_26490 [Vibrio coralliilyticus OCN008]QIJ84722.1 hypothetical protein G3U99_10885 [Vibrio coralliilyticus OCN008]
MQRAAEILGTSTVFQPNVNNNKVHNKGENRFSSLLEEKGGSAPKENKQSHSNDIYERIVYNKVVTDSRSKKAQNRLSIANGQYFQSLIASGAFVNQPTRVVLETKSREAFYSDSLKAHDKHKAHGLTALESVAQVKLSQTSSQLDLSKAIEYKHSRQDRAKSSAYSIATKSSLYQSRDFALVLVKVVTHKETLKVYLRDYRGSLSEAKISQLPEKLSQLFGGDIEIKHNGLFRRISGSTTHRWS